MRIISTVFTLCNILMLTVACTSNSKQPVVQESPKAGQRDDNKKAQTPNDTKQEDEQSFTSTIEDSSPSIPVVLDEKTLKTAYAFDTANMSYKFEYLTTKSDGDIKFENGKAHLDFKNLKDGEKGDLTLTLLEGGVAKLRGEKKDLVLAKGPNNIQLVLKAVSGSSDTADLVVNVELDQPATGNPPPSTGGGNPPPNTGGGNPPPNTGGGNPPPSTDPNAISFAKKIKPMMETHCTECHHQGGQSPDLTSKSIVEAKLDRVIIRIEGAGKPMPPSPRDRVSSAELGTLKSWKTQGFQP